MAGGWWEQPFVIGILLAMFCLFLYKLCRYLVRGGACHANTCCLTEKEETCHAALSNGPQTYNKGPHT